VTATDLYIDLLKRSLTNMIYLDAEIPNITDEEYAALLDRRTTGSDTPRPPFALTLIGWKRMTNVQELVERVLKEGVPGDMFEAGVWRGGAAILMRGILAAYGDTQRQVWAADSFAGLPPPRPDLYPADAGDEFYKAEALAVSLPQVKRNFARFGLLDDQVRFVEGYFHETLPKCEVERIAVLRLDGDMYESTIEALRALYDRVSPGGFIIIDDYGCLASCRQAVADFQAERGFTAEMTVVDWTGVYWRKPF